MLAACAAVLAGCSSAGASPPVTSGPATSSASSSDALIDGMVDIGSQRQIRVTCAGWDNPGPTVVLISDAQQAGDSWQAVRKQGAATTGSLSLEPSADSVFSTVAAFAPVCTYDRPGTKRLDESTTPSTKVQQPTTAQQDVDDLEAWLKTSNPASPYVLIGHGWGGMIATLFAATYPTQTAGVVLVDPASAYLEDHLTPAQWTAFLNASNALVDGTQNEAPNYRDSVGGVRVAQVGAIPVVVLSADTAFDIGLGLDAWPAWQAAADSLAKSIRSTHITATSSGHAIPQDNPAVVTTAIKDVVDQAR